VNRFLIRAGVDDESHEKAANETGFWGAKGAGCLLFSQASRTFLLGVLMQNAVSVS
jgi:hypothetical protein